MRLDVCFAALVGVLLSGALALHADGLLASELAAPRETNAKAPRRKGAGEASQVSVRFTDGQRFRSYLVRNSIAFERGSGAALSRAFAPWRLCVYSPQQLDRLSNFDDRDNTLIREGFDDDRLGERGWYDLSKIAVSTDAPAEGAGCLEFRWEDGATTPATTRGMRHLFEPSESVYVRFRIRLSKNWGWSGRSYHPHLMHFMTTENAKYHGPARSHLTLYIEPVGGKLRLAAQDIQNADAPHGLTQGPLRGGYNGRFYDSEDALFDDDRWHTVEAFFQLNTLDMKADEPNADGVARAWFDGKLVVDRDDIILRSTDFPAMKFNQYLLTPYFGPGLLPHAQTLWIDDLYIGTRRPDEVEKP